MKAITGVPILRLKASACGVCSLDAAGDGDKDHWAPQDTGQRPRAGAHPGEGHPPLLPVSATALSHEGR